PSGAGRRQPRGGGGWAGADTPARARLAVAVWVGGATPLPRHVAIAECILASPLGISADCMKRATCPV
ncbi:hypothetical protein NQU36_27310, partial [Escherichia coli]|uniref:hypothetical protein n=1 Tax=Escherichia coli TaxID=562 RepID=UPI0021194F6C